MGNQHDLLDVWKHDLYLITHAHYEAAVKFGRKNHAYGIPITVISAAVGTSVFATIDTAPELWLKIVAGLTSFAVTILSALQTFFKYSEREEKHRIAGAKFGSLLKEIEVRTHLEEASDLDFKLWADDFRGRWDELSLNSQTVPAQIFQKHRDKHPYSKHKSSED